MTSASDKVTNVVFAGLGGQGVITAGDVLADVAFRAGHDVKKAEVHGMSQRGGSVTSDIRFGRVVLSPMISPGEADFLVVLDETQVEPARHWLRPDGILLRAGMIDPAALPNPKTLNVALLGMLSAYTDIPESLWMEAVKAGLQPKLHEMNMQAFQVGKSSAQKEKRHG